MLDEEDAVTASIPTDRRVLRTRAMLRDALVGLMCEKGWEAVNVQMVCERANVGRSTFYTHFADKEELLVSGFDDLRRMMVAQRAPATGRIGFARGLIEHAYENKRLFRALVGRRSGQVVQNRFRLLVLELTKEELEGLGAPSAQLDAIARYVGGAFTELLIWSLDKPKPIEAAELEQLFQELTAGVLDRISAGAGGAGRAGEGGRASSRRGGAGASGAR
jgi:AcrR family transcriptional regulator